jgi:iron complex outermembrane receptor protein
MSMTRKAISVLIVCLAWAGSLAAQDQVGSITGRVVDAQTQQPIGNANVVIEGTLLGSVTTPSGTFVISQVPVGTYQVTANLIGYGPVTQEVTVTAGEAVSVNFSLPIQAVVMEELVTTGYGTQRRLAITGSVATVDAAEANVGVQSNVNDLLQGRVSGLNITRNSGEPGTGAQITIRGGTSLSASSEPLYIVDGVPIAQDIPTEANGIGIGGDPALPRSPLTLINPADIENITVLKDAAATAIYGSRAANGVILIETKQGAPGTVSFEYDGYVAISQPQSYLNLLNGAEYRDFVQAQVSAGNLDPSRLDGLGTANTDWERALTRTALTQNHDVSFAGGTQATRFRASVNYMDQEGIVQNNGFQRFQGRLNGTHTTLNDRLRLDLRLSTAQVNHDYLPFENLGGFEGGVFQNMAVYNPTFPVTITDPDTGEEKFFEIGTGRLSVRNPVAIAEQIEDVANTTRTLGTLKADLDVFSGLTATVSGSVDASRSNRRTFFPSASPVGAEWNGRAIQQDRDLTTLNLQTLLTYDGGVGLDHAFNVVGGYEVIDWTLRTFSAEARDFLTDAFSFSNLTAGVARPIIGSYEESALLVSVFGRANYSFKDRYFVTGVVRYDGASQFGAGNKWSLFPAVSASWRVSEEAFMADGPFSELRLRAGWGRQGNPAVTPYSSLITLEASDGASYPFGDQRFTGVAPNRNPNPDLKWEETEQWNVAIDFGFAGNRIAGTVEGYIKNTEDLLLEVPVAQPAAVPNRLENIGKIRNRGIEASLEALVINTPNVTWSAGLVFDMNRNEVVDLGGRTFLPLGVVSGQGQTGQNAQRLIPGETVGTFYGPEFIGVDAQGRQLFNQRDSDGNIIGETIQPTGDDFTVIGNANPDFSLGLTNRLSWGNFDGSMLLLSEIGQDVFNNTALVYSTKSNALQDKNFLRSAIDDPIGILEPAIFSDRWIENGSYLRLQNITIGYTFQLPSFVAGKMARVYAAADNLFLITGYDGYDPEVYTDAGLVTPGIDYLSYPRARTFTFGLRFEM